MSSIYWIHYNWIQKRTTLHNLKKIFSNFRLFDKAKNKKSVSQLKFSDFDFYKELISLTEENKEDFLFLKYTLLKNLRLPYDPNFFKKFDIEAGYSKKELEEITQSEKDYYENKSIRYDDIEINGFIENLKIKYETMDLLFENIDIFKYNIPYFFTSDNLNSILTLDFKEFMSDNSNIIRQCQNCGKYMVQIKQLKDLKNIKKKALLWKQSIKTKKFQLKNLKIGLIAQK